MQNVIVWKGYLWSRASPADIQDRKCFATILSRFLLLPVPPQCPYAPLSSLPRWPCFCFARANISGTDIPIVIFSLPASLFGLVFAWRNARRPQQHCLFFATP